MKKDKSLYPLKFIPVFKNYIWGGRNLLQYGKKLPEGIVAESWEVSCHPDGMSLVANGIHSGRTLESLIKEFGKRLVGKTFPSETEKFPLLIKLIDANDQLSVQVHPDDSYARVHEGEHGKNEMWYIIDAKPGAALIYDVCPGVTKEIFADAVKRNRVEECLQVLPVKAGDFVNIPAGMVHAIGAGIVLAEIQQNSNSTYRIYDYNRTDDKGNKRPLHLAKAMEVIDFNASNRKAHYEGLEYVLNETATAKLLVANQYYCVEKFHIADKIHQIADGNQFHVYMCTSGEGSICWGTESIPFIKGETAMIPSSIGAYSLCGKMEVLKAYVPYLEKDIFERLNAFGFSRQEILEKVSGLL